MDKHFNEHAGTCRRTPHKENLIIKIVSANCVICNIIITGSFAFYNRSSNIYE